MPAMAGPALVMALLLALAGAQKVLDPAPAVGALRQLHVPASTLIVRAGAAAELALGLWAIVWGGALPWALVAASYLAFAVFVALALQRGTMIGSCGCFGREDTPPHWSHVALNASLAVLAAITGSTVEGPVLAGLGDDLLDATAVAGLATVGTYLLYAVFVHLPRTLAAARDLHKMQ